MSRTDRGNRPAPSGTPARECIVPALLQLTRERPLSAINVSMLCRRAGISRMTFYRSYRSIEDVLVLHLAGLFEQYRAEPGAAAGLYCDLAHTRHFFGYVLTHREFLDGLTRCGLDTLFLQSLSDYILAQWQETASPATLAAFAGSLYNLFRLWSAGGYAEDPETLAAGVTAIYAGQAVNGER